MEEFHGTPLLLLLLISILSFATSSLAATSFQPNISHFIDCGSTTSFPLSNDAPPRTFKADSNFTGKDSFSLSNPTNSSSDPLYSTARVSSTNFKYQFSMESNSSNVLRLHFLPFSANSIDLSTAKFRVQALSYTLLDNFTVSNTSSPTIWEFFLWTDSANLEVEFIAQSNSHAFVSAIEAFTAPTELLNIRPKYTIGDTTLINEDLNKQVLETVYRVNMPGPLITTKNDTLWRTWVTDDPYILNAAVSQINSTSTSPNYIPYEGSSDKIAPPMVYSTAQ